MHTLQSAPARRQAYWRITAREKLGSGVRRAKNRRLSPACLERRCCQETDRRLGCAFEAAQGPVCARTSCVRELKHFTSEQDGPRRREPFVRPHHWLQDRGRPSFPLSNSILLA